MERKGVKITEGMKRRANPGEIISRIMKKLYASHQTIRKITFWIIVRLVGLLAFLKGLRIIEVYNENETKKVFRLRYDVYSKNGYIELSQFPNRLLHDKDDENSISFLALKGRRPVGTVRLTLGREKIISLLCECGT